MPPSLARLPRPAHKMPRALRTCGFVAQLAAIGIPVLVVILALVFFGTRKSVETVVTGATASKSRIQAHAIAFALGQTLFETRNQLLILAAGSRSKEEMAQRMHFRSQVPDISYRELAFVGIDPKDRYLLLNYGGEISDVDPGQLRGLANSPFRVPGRLQRPGEVYVSDPTEVTYPLLQAGPDVKGPATMHVIRFSTPLFRDENVFVGVLTLSIDISTLRRTITTFLSDAEDNASGEGGGIHAVFIDSEGWMIFQSETKEDSSRPLRLDAVRSGFRGDIGRAGFSTAFRPRAEYYGYWSMMNEIQHGRTGQFTSEEGKGWSDGSLPVETVSYAPIIYQDAVNGSGVVIGGVAVLDSSFTLSRTGTWLCVIYWVAGLAAFVIFMLLFVCVGRHLSRQVSAIGDQLANAEKLTLVKPLPRADEPKELARLRAAINVLLTRLRGLEQERDLADSLVAEQIQHERANALPWDYEPPAGGIAGESPVMKALRQSIAQAASVGADVLIVGETGTGKELVSRAIHDQSSRRSGPFITINCGALDESLLMDTLFGHVKGAFTEAKQARKGAFLTASGGTLMLDEIGTASPKVQQALLRALSDRCIHPLGSDEFIRFDTRVIAATNADLQADVKAGKFREDLYFRLAVITIRTPALRDHKMDIPSLVVTFMKEGWNDPHEGYSGVQSISRGAMTQIMHYHWPGNVRELRNCILRAMAFCDGDIILREHLNMGADAGFTAAEGPACLWRGQMEGRDDDAQARPADGKAEGRPRPAEPAEEAPSKAPQARQEAPQAQTAAASGEGARQPAADAAQPGDGAGNGTPKAARKNGDDSGAKDTPAFNGRIRAVLPRLRTRRAITRQEYQDMVGEGISARTAQYDLQLLVEAGLLAKEGRGPSQRYVVARADGRPGKEGQ